MTQQYIAFVNKYDHRETTAILFEKELSIETVQFIDDWVAKNRHPGMGFYDLMDEMLKVMEHIGCKRVECERGTLYI